MKKTAAAALALGAALAIRAAFVMTRDLRRYDRLRSLSNEGPVLQELPDMLAETLARERQFGKDLIEFLRALPKDVIRYMRIETM